MGANSADEFETIADQLCEATLALEQVDLNLLLDDEVRAVLDAKDELSVLCSRYRQDQHVAERDDEEDADGE